MLLISIHTNKIPLLYNFFQSSSFHLGAHNRSGIAHHNGIYMHSNNDILDVVDAQSSAGVLGSRDNPSTADGTRNAIHQQWNRDSLLGRSYRDVREVVAANTLPSYHALTSIPSSNSRDNTLSRELHHFTVRSIYLSSSTKIFIKFPLCEMTKL